MTNRPLADQASTRPSSLRRTLRLAIYFSCLSLAAGLLIARRASAELSERSLSLGRKLDTFHELIGRTTRLSWNGQELTFSTLVVKQPVAQVLERFVALCAVEQGSVARELAQASNLSAGAMTLIDRIMVVRDLFADGSGTGLCLAGLGQGGLRSLSERLRHFAHSQDLSELGQLRFARFRTTEAGHTHVLLVAADGPLQLDRLLPTQGGDAEGEDALPGVRPLPSVRVVSARTHGTPHAFTAYRTPHSPETALADYAAQLKARGYARVTPSKAREPIALSASDYVLSEAYQRGGEAFVITTQADEEGSILSVVKLAELAIPAPGQAAEAGRSLVGRGQLGGARDPAFE